MGLAVVLVFFDDIVIGGQNEKEHESRLRARINDDGLCLNKSEFSLECLKCPSWDARLTRKAFAPQKKKSKLFGSLLNYEKNSSCNPSWDFFTFTTFTAILFKGAAHVLEFLHCLLYQGTP